ncbi:MAG TPA: ABC transporter substrate-binding protein [Candidatus Acidoferrales bacterium]|nr:ABC transporter substrate-binding protein [Candidatus Acidoferrales bacterium]
MRLRSFLLLATLSALALAGTRAAERPRSGGTLRVELGASVMSLDPAVRAASPSEADGKSDLAGLVFESLVRLDTTGAPQPVLVDHYDKDSTSRHWTFHLLAGVHFHDGAALTPDVAAAALANPDPSWTVSNSADSVIIETRDPTPDLPYLLAESRHALVHRGPDGSLAGTGPFKLTTWEAGKHVVFAANEDYREGRPFLEGVDVALGVASRERMIALQLAKADLVDLPPALVRRATDDKLRTTVTVPVDLVAVVFELGGEAGERLNRAPAQDPRVRQAIAHTIDREAIASFILQKQGDATGALLPQWLSGTAFLFSTAYDPSDARALWAQIKPAPALVLGYDSGEALDEAIAERIAVNAREAGIAITSRAISSANRSGFDARLVRLRLASPEPRVALTDALENFTPLSSASLSGTVAEPPANPATAEEVFESERAALEGYRVVPIVYMPRIYGVGNRVRNWQIRASEALSGWQLADVWIEGEGP